MITVYGKDSCPYCDKAKKLLEANNIPFLYIECKNVNPHIAEQIAKELHWDTWPKIVQPGKPVCGYNDLKNQLEKRNGK
jgi:glutaredoxin